MIKNIINKKNRQKISILTCYDFSFAKILNETNLDAVLVGDSLANVLLGLEDIKEISFAQMYNHVKAVAKAADKKLVIADMPYVCYQKEPKKALYYANKFIKAGAGAIKLEWFKDILSVTKTLIKNNIAVMGHIGLTPQTAHLLGGFKVQGKDKKAALNLIDQALKLEAAGVFSLVLECVPQELARIITSKIKIPTIGIGSGRFCDGQVLVLYDLLGLYPKRNLKFVRLYKDLAIDIKIAVNHYATDVKNNNFPQIKESFSMDKQEFQSLIKGL